jgi:hypothetical protein
MFLQNKEESETCINLRGEWVCIVCDVRLPTIDQMRTHEAGERHAYSLAHMKARGPDYLDHCFWRTVQPAIPAYPSPFPCDKLPDDNLDRRPAPHCESEERIHEFFRYNYRNKLTRGDYYCEPCDRTFPDFADFEGHMACPEHRKSLSQFVSIEVDYFQPVRAPESIFFLGLVSGKVFRDIDFFEKRQKILELQWKVANRIPSSDSCIMMGSPDDFITVFTLE